MRIEFQISISLSDRAREHDKIRAAQQVLLMMAAEIVRASAAWDGRAKDTDPKA